MFQTKQKTCKDNKCRCHEDRQLSSRWDEYKFEEEHDDDYENEENQPSAHLKDGYDEIILEE